MKTAVISINASPARARQAEVLMLGIASAVALAAAGSLLGHALFFTKRRPHLSGQIVVGVLAGCAGLVTWLKREEEIEAAHHFAHQVHVVRDARWLKKHPVAYG